MFSTVTATVSPSTLVVTQTAPWVGRLWTIALCSRFVVICRNNPGDPIVAAMSPRVSMVMPCFSASGRSVSVASSATREVDLLSGEGPLDGAAEEEQSLGEVDRPGVDGVEAVDESPGSRVGILPGDLEEGLRDRQRRTQLVGGVGHEPLLLGDLSVETSEHGIEAVGELAELVLPAFQARSGGALARQRSVASGQRGANAQPTISVAQRRHHARDLGQPLARRALQGLAELRHRRQQAARIRMARRREQRVDRRLLDLAAGIHHDHALRPSRRRRRGRG